MIWQALPRFTRRTARLLNRVAEITGYEVPIRAGGRTFDISFPGAERSQPYPLALEGKSRGQRLRLYLDVEAIDPGLAADALSLLGAEAGPRVVAHLQDWLCAIDGLIGVPLQPHALIFNPAARAPLLHACIVERKSRRLGRIAFSAMRTHQWLLDRPDLRHWRSERRQLGSSLRTNVAVCLPGPRLPFRRLRNIHLGDVFRVTNDRPILRLRTGSDFTNIQLVSTSGGYMVDDQSPMTRTALEPTVPLVSTDMLEFNIDVVLTNLPMTFGEIGQIGSGTIFPIKLPLHHRRVTIRCEGVPFAVGDLVQVQDSLGVRIDQMCRIPPP